LGSLIVEKYRQIWSRLLKYVTHRVENGSRCIDTIYLNPWCFIVRRLFPMPFKTLQQSFPATVHVGTNSQAYIVIFSFILSSLFNDTVSIKTI
jgi:hypothetical protein